MQAANHTLGNLLPSIGSPLPSLSPPCLASGGPPARASTSTSSAGQHRTRLGHPRLVLSIVLRRSSASSMAIASSRRSTTMPPRAPRVSRVLDRAPKEGKATTVVEGCPWSARDDMGRQHRRLRRVRGRWVGRWQRRWMPMH
jgi:hypothetical protein